MLNESFNDKYYFLKTNSNHNSLFASFKVFKTMIRGNLTGYGRRPPYPIINGDPTFSEVFYNMNKSDYLVGFTFLPIGFLLTLGILNHVTLLNTKFIVMKNMMLWYSFLGFFAASLCSFYRLEGLMDNGLRWKHKEMLDNKYDFTSDFERNTIFKHFRIRLD
jgi:hypothetical protein